MKIGIVVRGLTEGGVSRFILNVLGNFDAINDSDIKIYIIHNEKKIENKYKYLEEIYIKQKNKILFDYAFSFFKLKKLKLDVLIYPKNVIPLTHFLLRARKINIIHDLAFFEKSLDAYPLLDTLFMKTFMKLSCARADKTIAVSNYTKKDIQRKFNLSPDKIVVVYEGIESIFKQKTIDEKWLKHRDIHFPFLLYTGSISPRKNLLRTLKSFNKIKNKIPHHFYITGQKSWKHSHVSDYIETNLKDRVTILGHLADEELINFYNLASLYVYPSLYEGFGLPILEAQSCGCPVLTSNVTSCPEVAGDGAVFVDPYNIEKTANTIEETIKDKKLRDELTRRGLNNIKRFSWKKSAERILNICDELTENV